MQEQSAKDFYEQVHGHHQFLSKGTILNLLDAYRDVILENEREKKEAALAEKVSVTLGV